MSKALFAADFTFRIEASSFFTFPDHENAALPTDSFIEKPAPH
jgi:hypothetical protein